ncbi:DNA repair ATPase [Pseudomonas sp. JZ134]|uniref:DNA repair ATPase n=1 Tax=Pseudomonas sp. JZ134 TaxID=2806615 RepID=UPI003DA02B22
MSDLPAEHLENHTLDKAVTEGGAYEVLDRRLKEHGRQLDLKTQQLNAGRLDAFGDSRMEVVGRVRIRTENNCIARDIVQVGGCLLFGYNVFLGLKKETEVADVFSLYRLAERETGYEAEPVELAQSFLAEPGFTRDFNELYAYYKGARLLQLVLRDNKLLASFQIGARISDIRVFRWAISPDGSKVSYLDNRGERDIALPAPFDFEWTKTTREMRVNGRHPHVNILDTVFIETIGGDLTIKVENNTNDGQGIYREPVTDASQSLDDAQIEFARLGSLVLLKVLPYREEQWRYLVFNGLTKTVERIDAIGQACIQLPEDHGIIFPGGYYLQNGEHRTFDQPMAGMRFKHAFRSPNGEDVQYVFYHPEEGRSALFTYNLITRQLQKPLFGHGYARLDDGRMVLFAAEGDEPTRIHPMQIWQTPFASEEYASQQKPTNSFYGRIGNPELVRGISDLLNLVREISAPARSAQRYSQLCHAIRRLFDAYHWLDDKHTSGLAELLREVSETAEQVLDEYQKVESIQLQSRQAMAEAQTRLKRLQESLHPDSWEQIQDYVDALNNITRQRGQLLTIRDYRYVDTSLVDVMEQELLAAHERIAVLTASFLSTGAALAPFQARLEAMDAQARQAESVIQLTGPLEDMNGLAADLDMLSHLMASLKIDDATQRTQVIESVSEVYARLNQARARLEQQRKQMGNAETVAQFGAQFSLFGQAITNALALASDPERCDEEMSRLLLQLEELESQFGEQEAFLADILSKREELIETFESHRQMLEDERQRKAQTIQDAASRILLSLQRRTSRFESIDELNAFFASDPLIIKLRDMAERLRQIKDSIKADDIEARLKAARDQAVRVLRDRNELFVEDGQVIKLGPRHRFSVNTQELDLTLMPRGEALYLHLTGTEFMEPLSDPSLEALKLFWQVSLESESAELYRGEYLAGLFLQAAAKGTDSLTMETLYGSCSSLEEMTRLVREFASPRYREGYQRGIHDQDAAKILIEVLSLREQAGLLAFSPLSRAIAVLFWSTHKGSERVRYWSERARAALELRTVFHSEEGVLRLQTEVAEVLRRFVQTCCLPADETATVRAATYLVEELGSGSSNAFCFSRYARLLVDALKTRLVAGEAWDRYCQTLDNLAEEPSQAWSFSHTWFDALCCHHRELQELAAYIPEAVALSLWRAGEPCFTEVDLTFEVNGLLGDHPRIEDGRLSLVLADYLERVERHQQTFIPQFRHYQNLRQQIIQRERTALCLSEFKPRPLSSFVRNRLINEVYLAIIGDNLAKQMGTVGQDKRTDLMGLLMLISPPGYGKTTLMEYVASRLGLVFMKVNGPALGHSVRSLDPTTAPDATSARELEKLNLALEMGNNVMLYVDDIQHTHPEFLQKFISLCDGTRRIEGVWRGRTRTYDLRAKKFCVVMSGNPYTESGEVFRIPDMLANRADIYNLGDTLSGMDEAFALSYIENALTSNPVLAPLATREMSDVYALVARAEGKPASEGDLSFAYSAAETGEIVGTLKRLVQIRNVVLKVNEQYIASAAQADRYRTEPVFKLQGSYRNMNKMAEKVSAVMNDQELQALITDHYQGEAQLLTTGAEENLLKLAELRGLLDPVQEQRWEQIKQEFIRNRALGNGEDIGGRVVMQLAALVEGVQGLGRALATPPTAGSATDDLLSQLGSSLERVLATPRVQVVNQPVPGIDQLLRTLADTLEQSFLPLVRNMDRKLDIDLANLKRLEQIAQDIRAISS